MTSHIGRVGGWVIHEARVDGAPLPCVVFLGQPPGRTARVIGWLPLAEWDAACAAQDGSAALRLFMDRVWLPFVATGALFTGAA